MFSSITHVYYVSGTSVPFTVVESQSMQHSDTHSEIGVIDTGDMVLVRTLDKNGGNVTTFVEGYHSDEKSFGKYGQVIVYYRENHNPVIHRAMLYLERNPDGITWSAPSLEHYKDKNGNQLWWNKSMDYNNLYGNILLTDDWENPTFTSQVNLNAMKADSGYLTMGDNNGYFDQNGIFKDLIEDEDIKSIAWKEIPWLGTIKFALNNNHEAIDRLDTYAPNSMPNLGLSMFMTILVLFSISCVFDSIEIIWAKRKYQREIL